MPGQSPTKRLQQDANLHPPTRQTLRGPFPITNYSRSVSLPQALQTLTLSNRSSYSKSSGHGTITTGQSSSQVGSASGTAERIRVPVIGENPDASAQNFPRATKSNVYAQQGVFPSPSYNIRFVSHLEELETSPSMILSPPSSTTTKRVASENPHGPLGIETSSFPRGRINPQLVEIIRSAKIQPLDPPPPNSNFSAGMDVTANNHGANFSYDIAERLCHNEVEATSHTLSFDDHQGKNVRPRRATEQALSNPDILAYIFDALDAMTVIPHEIVQQRRKPLSLRHAQLIFGNNKQAVEAWEQSQPTTTGDTSGAGLYNCLTVNSIWYDAAVRVLEHRIHFRTNESWTRFARRGVAALSRKPKMLVLHKLSDATQVELDMIDHINLGEKLEWLEFYTCVGLAPPPSLIGPQLTRIILPGCYRVNDRTLAQIALTCSRLEHLDVRACEQVSDRGVKLISKYCPLLKLINVGRTRAGDLITYKGIKHLARQTQITTLGIAGCNIDDRALWELALNRGPKLQRLSLNNCHLLTDSSIPRVLGYMPNLTVLEIRGCVQMTHMRPIALFKAYREKQGKPSLIEGCEVIERRLQIAILRLQRETSQRILSELSSWINSEDDEKPIEA